MRPHISIVVPISNMADAEFYFWRCINSIVTQSFTDYEIVITKNGRASENQNSGIERARGELVKILHMDDYFTTPDSLQTLVDNFNPSDTWMVTGCLHQQKEGPVINPHLARYSADIHTGNNTIGAPSVLLFRNEGHLKFDVTLDWLYDVEYYRRYYDTFGAPKILDDLNVVIGLHPGQLTHAVPNEQKLLETMLMIKKYE